MTDLNERLSQLEASVRRLRLASTTLAVALVGVVAMAAAPSTAQKPTELVFEADGYSVRLSAQGLMVSGHGGTTEIRSKSVEVKQGVLRGLLEVKDRVGFVGVVKDDGKSGPASASLQVDDSKSQPAGARVVLADEEGTNAVFSKPAQAR